MATPGFVLGRSVKVIVNHVFAGGRLDLGNVTGFDPKQRTKAIQVSRIDGTVLTQYVPDGWEGTIEFTRRDATVEQFISAVELAFRNGVTIPYGQVYQYVTELNGSRTQWLYENSIFHLPNAGKYQPESDVKMALGFSASWRTTV